MESAPLPSDDSYLLPEPTPAEAEAYLDKFRSWLPRFPFMVLPKDQTAENLRKEKPFLWLCIMNITTTSHPQQVKMKERVRQEAAQRVIVDHERSMDVLLGLVCYIAWQVELIVPSFRMSSNTKQGHASLWAWRKTLHHHILSASRHIGL
jgi:hypothetical protein